MLAAPTNNNSTSAMTNKLAIVAFAQKLGQQDCSADKVFCGFRKPKAGRLKLKKRRTRKMARLVAFAFALALVAAASATEVEMEYHFPGGITDESEIDRLVGKEGSVDKMAYADLPFHFDMPLEGEREALPFFCFFLSPPSLAESGRGWPCRQGRAGRRGLLHHI